MVLLILNNTNFHFYLLVSPPQKVALKKSKSCAKLVAEVAQKVALKLRAISNLAHFWM